jgi:hypothetical protein
LCLLADVMPRSLSRFLGEGDGGSLLRSRPRWLVDGSDEAGVLILEFVRS